MPVVSMVMAAALPMIVAFIMTVIMTAATGPMALMSTTITSFPMTVITMVVAAAVVIMAMAVAVAVTVVIMIMIMIRSKHIPERRHKAPD